MVRRDKWLIALGLVLIVGAAVAVLAYGLYRRSSFYRESLAANLGQRLGMFVDIGRVRSLSSGGTALDDVRVYLEEGRDQVFSCAEVLWNSAAGGDDSNYTLELSDGWLLIGTPAWTESEYRRVLKSGLGHDFGVLGLAGVRLKGIDLRFTHPAMEFRAGATSGVVLFDDDGTGQASLTCRAFNGVQVAEPIHIAMRFIPGGQLVIEEVRLTVPTIEVAALGIEALLKQTVSSGQFDGSVTYRETAEGQTLDVTGSLWGARLAEFTGQVPGGPFHGTLDVDLNEARIVDRRLRRLDAHGRLTDLRVGEIAPRLASPGEDDRLAVTVDQVRWVDDRIAYLSARASCERFSVDALAALWGRGAITGQARLDVRSLVIIDDQLRAADVEIVVEPPANTPGWIDRDLVASAAQQWLGVDLTAALPERVEYTDLGVRLILNDDALEVLGTHGPEGRTILTVNLFDRPWGVIRQPDRAFVVPDLVGLVRDSAADVDAAEIGSWWQWLQSPPAPPG